MQEKFLLNDLLFKPRTTTYQVYSIWTDGKPVYVGYTSKDLKVALLSMFKRGIDFHTNDGSYIKLEDEPLLSVNEAKARKIVLKEEYCLIPGYDTTIKEVK